MIAETSWAEAFMKVGIVCAIVLAPALFVFATAPYKELYEKWCFVLLYI